MRILYFPVAHPELNPIELIWSLLKDYIMKRNANYSLIDLEELAFVFFDTYDESEWKKCIDHVKKLKMNTLKWQMKFQ